MATNGARAGWEATEDRYLGLGTATANAKRVEALRAGLRQLAWVESKNIAIEFRWADEVSQLPALAAELVRMNVDVIFASSSTQVEAAEKRRERSPSFSRIMQTRSASATWRACRAPTGTLLGSQCS